MKKKKYRKIIKIFLLLVLLSPICFISAFLIYFFIQSEFPKGDTFSVAGSSMLPTFTESWMLDLTLCKAPDCVKNLERGDFIVYKHDRKFIVKRIIAISGDKIAIDNRGDVYLNSKLLFERYLNNPRSTYTSDTNFINNKTNPVVLIPDGQYFVMGDNREHSEDSRNYGPVKLKDIISYAKFLKYNKANLRAFTN